jgi:peptidoglycan/xylan/chitin deacetylase (PgdA/CDA1 family)
MAFRQMLRDGALHLLALGRRVDATTDWIRFPYYHHVYDDERTGFGRQLDFMRSFGDFISIDDAIGLLISGERIGGRYFCLSFDDGFKSCATNAVSLLAERDIPAVFYVVTGLVGRTLVSGDSIAIDAFGAKSTDSIEFVSWDDCRALIRGGMTLGSHTCSHPRLASLDAAIVQDELVNSKLTIERQTESPCRHFCAPYGMPHRDFGAKRDVQLARNAGYVSFATGVRGRNLQNGDAFMLHRDHLIATWGNHQLRYFLSAN